MSASQQRLAVAFFAGLLFAFGLAVSGMTQPSKVIGFLDVAGAWDPSLLCVMGGAVGVYLLGSRFVLRRPTPALDDCFRLPEREDVDVPLLAGAALFGVGWGLGGYCPGPVIVALGAGTAEALVFVPSMALAMLAYDRLRRARGIGRPVE